MSVYHWHGFAPDDFPVGLRVRYCGTVMFGADNFPMGGRGFTGVVAPRARVLACGGGGDTQLCVRKKLE